MKSIEPHSRINPAENPATDQEEVIIPVVPLSRGTLADRVLQSWPITLRLAVLLAILLAGLAATAAVGFATPLLLVAGGYQMRRWLRRNPGNKANQ
jgi:hypothetical protein